MRRLAAAAVGAFLLLAWVRAAGCGRDAAGDAPPVAAIDAMWQRHPLTGTHGDVRAHRALVLWGYEDAPWEEPRQGQTLVPIRALADGDTRPARPRARASSIAARVPARLQRALEISPNKLHDIQVRLSPPDRPASLSQWLDDAIARGEITGEPSLAAARRAWVADRRARARATLDPPAAAVMARGGRVIERYAMLQGLRIAATRDMLLDLLQRFPVTRVDETVALVADGQSAAGRIAASRRAVSEGHQLAQLARSGSASDARSRLHMALWEYGGWPYPDPAAWRRGESSGSGLELRLEGCRAPDCSDAAARHAPHASATLAVLRADVLGLLPSGLTVHAHAIEPTSLARVIDDTIASPDDIRVVSMSASIDPIHDWSCRGVDLVSRDVDALFEAGILVIKSAGNRGSSARGCTVGPPGAATTVLTVAALAAGRDDAGAVRRAPVLTASSVGGAMAAGPWEPGDRPVIGLAAQGCRRESIADTGRAFIGCGTSFSTPTVAAAALLELAFWERDQRTAFFHHRPGALMALLLAMGDGFAPEAGQGTDGPRRQAGLDRRTGAGRLELRRLDRSGLDAPWGYQIADTCVSRDEIQYIPDEDGIAVPPGVDILKAALFWYDPEIDDSGRMNDLDLSIETAGDEPTTGSARRWRELAASTSPSDNRERLIVRGVGGQRLRLAIRGSRVESQLSDPACGAAQRAYLASFYEDSRRDDPDRPTSINAASE
ncbi:MAG TPA: S8 family serine peptidase [Kofleriaceae bacterium]|nr:S8 family serine peptidase [Kofleriaceae bacterium]